MIIVNNRVYRLLVMTALLALFLSGLIGYVSVAALEDLSRVKAIAERILFYPMVFSLILVLIFISIRLKAADNTRQLDNLFTAGSRDMTNEKEWSRRLGPLGERFLAYNRELMATSTKKSLKIEGLSKLVRLLMHNSSSAYLVLDTQGTILYASAEALSRLQKTSAEILQTPITRHLPEIKPVRLALDLSRTLSPITLTAGSGRSSAEITAAPVIDSRNECAYILLSLEGRNLKSFLERNPVKAPETGKRHGLFRFFPKKEAR